MSPRRSPPPAGPEQPAGRSGDPYARVDYRRLIAWPRRIRREAPLLRELLAAAPERSVLDLGCGTGEHVAFFADEGARALGLDRSKAMLAKAAEHEASGCGRFLLGDALDAPLVLGHEPPFGLAICLGNVLPHLLDEQQLRRWIDATRQVLLPGGLALVQLLNYRRILDRGERSLPINVRPAPPDTSDGPADVGSSGSPGVLDVSHPVVEVGATDASGRPDAGAPDEMAAVPDPREIVFLRLMRDEGDGRMLFFPTTLELDPDAEQPVRVVSSRRVPLAAWTDDDLHRHYTAAGFRVECFGDMQRGTYVPAESRDLVLVARRG